MMLSEQNSVFQERHESLLGKGRRLQETGDGDQEDRCRDCPQTDRTLSLYKLWLHYTGGFAQKQNAKVQMPCLKYPFKIVTIIMAVFMDYTLCSGVVPYPHLLNILYYVYKGN